MIPIYSQPACDAELKARIPKELRERAEAVAKKFKVSMSDLVRSGLIAVIEQLESEASE